MVDDVLENTKEKDVDIVDIVNTLFALRLAGIIN